MDRSKKSIMVQADSSLVDYLKTLKEHQGVTIRYVINSLLNSFVKSGLSVNDYISLVDKDYLLKTREFDDRKN